MKRIVFFDTKPYDKESFELVNRQHGYEIIYLESKLTPRTAVMAKDSDVVCAFVNDDLQGETIDELAEAGVRLIAMRCAGYNNVDLNRAKGRIRIARVPAYSPYAVAEHAMGMLLTLNRKLHRAYNRVRENNFSLNGLTGFDIHGKTVGVIGTGKIGRTFIELCSGFGVDVLTYDPYPVEGMGYHYVALDELFGRSDIISLHCPLTKESFHMIDREALAKMKQGVVIINTSRGALIDSEAILDAIKDGKVGAAALDVYEEEADVFYEDNSDKILLDDILARLLSMPNVLVTSHQAFLTREALNNIAETTLKNIDDFYSGGAMENEILI